MFISKPAYRALLIAAAASGAVAVSAGAAAAYDMQDYYNAEQAVDSDNQQIADMQGDIASLQQQINDADDFYRFQMAGCGGTGPGQPPRDPSAAQDCRDAYQVEWDGVVNGLYADLYADQSELPFLEAEQAQDVATLQTIKSALGL